MQKVRKPYAVLVVSLALLLKITASPKTEQNEMLRMLIGYALWLRLKARLEEQFLFEELGPVIYGKYKARTPMLVSRMPRRPDTD